MQKSPPSFADFFRGRTVLITGHTGFKGSWLAVWLRELGAKVIGYSTQAPSRPSHFEAARLEEKLVHVDGDVRDFERLHEVMRRHRPSIVFHLAAQALVREGYRDRRYTFETNYMGTINVVEAASAVGVEVVVPITTDKCYENREWIWGYRESDRLGGQDPYSASKAAAEMALNVYRSEKYWRSVNGTRPHIASGRGGNVIGGGDWAADRLIPDVVRSLAAGTEILVRSPASTRPWQHVLDALSGYLTLAWRLGTGGERQRLAPAYNYGPRITGRGVPVLDVVTRLKDLWGDTTANIVTKPSGEAESGLLQLDSTRAEADLGWRATWDLDTTLERVVHWYRHYYAKPDEDNYGITRDQIRDYVADAAAAKQVWA